MATNKSSRRKLTPLAAAALLLVLVLAVGGTLAWLTAKTDPITNTFTAATSEIEIVEEFANQTKSNVKVQNKGNVPVYIRVALIPTWGTVDAGGVFTPVGEPASLSDLDIDWGKAGVGGGVYEGADVPGNDWIKIGEYWYYTLPVPPGTATDNDNLTKVLIAKATVKADSVGAKAGYRMNLQVMADSIQASPDAAVEAVWPVTVNTSVATGDKTLTEKQTT